ncbi:MAG TPA: hypothetical protein VFU47_02855 [Armatimonadota bacterium]|nr:hypothetical protein [Armatimonadota bacterium]
MRNEQRGPGAPPPRWQGEGASTSLSECEQALLSQQRKLVRIALQEARLLARAGEVTAAGEYLDESKARVSAHARRGERWAQVLEAEWATAIRVFGAEFGRAR